MNVGPNIAAVGALVGVPTRAAMLWALAGGQALPASELAYRAYLSPQTASSHLAKMVDGGLLVVERCGRHRYYRMANAEVSQIVEQLMALAPAPRVRGRPDMERNNPLRRARSCYGHLAGRLGVLLTASLSEQGLVQLAKQDYLLTRAGEAWFLDFGIDPAVLKKQRRMFARRCIDWSERLPHLGGALGDAFATRLFELKWIKRAKRGRAVLVTNRGGPALKKMFGVTL